MDNVIFVRASVKYAESYNKIVDLIARERKYLASTEGFPLTTTTDFVKKIESENLAQFYAIDGDTVIGWCDILPKPFEGRTHVATLGMGIHRKYRQSGIGTKLIALCFDHAKSWNNIEKVELEVFKSNESATKFYTKIGFEKEGEQQRSRKLDGKYDNIILMGKFI